MNVKKLTIGVAVIAVAAIILSNFKNESSSTSVTEGELFDAALLNDTTEILVSENGVAKVRMTNDGSGWSLPDNDGFPVEFDRVDRLAKLLKEAKILRLVTSNPDRMARLELGSTQVTLKDKAGKELFDLKIGKRHEKGGNYISVADREGAYLVKDSVYADRKFENWINKGFIPVESDEIKAFKLSFKSDPLASLEGMRNNKEAEWTSPSLAFDEAIKDEKIKGVLDAVTGLRYTKYTPQDDEAVVEAMNHSQSLSFETFDGVKFDLKVGQKPSPEHKEDETEEEHAAHSEKNPVYVVMSFSDPAKSWYKPASKYAFEVYEHSYNSLPDKRSSFMNKVAATEPIEVKAAE